MVKLADIRVGDTVKIVDKWCHGCMQNTRGRMDKYLGTVMTVKVIYGDSVRMFEDEHDGIGGGGWMWLPAAIECIIDDSDMADSYNETIESIDGFVSQFRVSAEEGM